MKRARHWERIIAWLIDFVIVGIIFGFLTNDFSTVLSLHKYILLSLFFFVYWTILEGYNGQSIGKMIMQIKIALNKEGKIGIKTSALQSFGKSFILPLDIIIGLVFRPDERTRIFNILSQTSVVKIKNN